MTDGSMPLFTPRYENRDNRRRKPDFELIVIILCVVILFIVVFAGIFIAAVSNVQVTTEASANLGEDVINTETQENASAVGTTAISYTPEYYITINIDGEEYELEGKEIYDKCKDKVGEEISAKIISSSDGKSITKAR